MTLFFSRYCVGVCLLLALTQSIYAQIQIAVPGETNNVPDIMATGDILEFSDGSILHGLLKEADRGEGVRWSHPDMLKDATFRPDHLQSIRFQSATPSTRSTPMPNRFHFRNGDELLGELLSLDEKSARLNTRFAKNLRVERDSLESITFLSKHFNVLYEGPTGLDGWTSGRTGQRWKYREGAFFTEHVGSIGRNFDLPATSSIEFDIAWEGQLGLIVQAYTDNVDRFDYSSSSYMFYINANSIGLQRVSPETGISNMGNVQLPRSANRNQFRLEIRANREEATIAIYVDGNFLNKWRDNSGFAGKGSGALFFSQHEGPKLRISNLKVSEWDGSFDNSIAETSLMQDTLFLANRDKVDGNVIGLQNGKLKITTDDTPLEIPVARITHIQFASGPSKSDDPISPWQVRASLGGGEKLSFELTRWSTNTVTGTNSSFGKIEFSSASIRQLQFVQHNTSSGIEGLSDTWPLVSRDDTSALSSDALILRNGDMLLGKLAAIDPGSTLRWSRDDSVEPLEFKPSSASEVRLQQIQHNATNDCEVTFVNGGQLRGKLLSISDKEISLETWYAGKLSLPRQSIMMIVPLQEDQTPIFAGIDGLEGWAMGEIKAVDDSGQWTYQDGAFYATKAASIARDVKLPDVASIQFDIAWKGLLQMAVALYTDRLQPVSLANKDAEPDFGGFYSLQIGSSSAGLLMVKKGAPINYLWQMPTPLLSQKNQAHVEIRVDKPRRMITLMIDGVIIKQTVDPDGFAGTGSALRFVHQGVGSLRLSNLRVTEWDGLFEEPYSNKSGTQELIRLRNDDRVTGRIESFKDGKLTVLTEDTKLEIPWQRIKQLEYPGKLLATSQNEPVTALGYFQSGAPLKFNLQRWDEKGIHLENSEFGNAVFNPAAFSRIRFNFRNQP